MWDVQRHQNRRSEERFFDWGAAALETRKTWNNCDLSIRIIDATVKMLNSHNLQKKKWVLTMKHLNSNIKHDGLNIVECYSNWQQL